MAEVVVAIRRIHRHMFTTRHKTHGQKWIDRADVYEMHIVTVAFGKEFEIDIFIAVKMSMER